MSVRRPLGSALLSACLMAACGTAASVPSPSLSKPTAAPTVAPSPSGDGIAQLADSAAITAGTYRLASAVLGSRLPSARITVPAGWMGHTWYLDREAAGDLTVGLSFWNVAQVYGHPCKWSGTLFDPGPTAADLATALKDRPLRHATVPADVRLGGYSGKYLEWSVPSDIEFSQIGNPAPSAGCDADEGGTAFYSFTGQGMAENRYQQGPGQLDRLWMVDVPGGRAVIDATSMPSATSAEIAEMLAIVESIRFEP